MHESLPRIAATRLDVPRAFYPGSDLDALIADIGARLRPVCTDMPRTVFDAMVRDIAALKVRWAQQEGDALRATLAFDAPIATARPPRAD